VAYDAGLIGTLAVPPAIAVALGVPVDNTTGTAVLTEANVAAAIAAASLATASQVGQPGNPDASPPVEPSGLYEAISEIAGGLTSSQATQLANIWATVSQIGSGGVTIHTPWIKGGDLVIYQDDDYLAAKGRQIPIANAAGTWAGGDLDGSTITLTISRAGSIVLQVNATVIAGGPGSARPTTGQAAYFELTKAQTALLTVLGKSYVYQVLIVSSGDRETRYDGAVVVKATNNPLTG